MSDKLRVVLDTQLFLRILINPRSLPAKLAPQLWRDIYTLCIADQIEAEITDVLNRPKVRAKFPQITDAAVQELLKILREEAELIVVSEVLPVSRDPQDDIFLACAKAAKAKYLVSEDQDLLVLKTYADTQIINAAEFLVILKSYKDEMDRIEF